MDTREKLIKWLCEAMLIFDKKKNEPSINPFEVFADHLIANGVTVIVRCKDCEYWSHKEGGFGDCTNGRFHLDGHADPTMSANDYCSCGERRGGK